MKSFHFFQNEFISRPLTLFARPTQTSAEIYLRDLRRQIRQSLRDANLIFRPEDLPGQIPCAFHVYLQSDLMEMDACASSSNR